MSKHTPGPWDARKAANGDYGIGKSPGVLLAECFVDIRSLGENATGECEANARLISAAPELLDALKDLCEEVEEYELGNPSTLRAARAAIAKAEQDDE